jgi:succinate dehydrogenase/fumarate reductase flavoprotein subunit
MRRRRKTGRPQASGQVREPLTRREVLAGAGIAAGAAALPELATAATAAKWDHETDVVCVGGGAAGCTAAATAAAEGSKVILIDKAPILGGTTRRSGGVAWIPNHGLLASLGLHDDKHDCMRYMCRFAYPHLYDAASPTLGLGEPEYKLIEAFYDNGSKAIERLKSEKIVEFGVFTVGEDKKPSPDYADHLPENKLPAGRAIVPIDAKGNVMEGQVGHGGRIVDSIEAWLTKKGGTVLTEHRATRLIKDGDRVIGVEATAGDKTVRLRARRAVVFGTGGFAHNLELIKRHQAMLYGSCAVAQSVGDFVQISMQAGARMGYMGSAWRTQVVLEQALENHVMGVGVFFVPGDSMLLVNKYGVRAVNEKRDYNDRTRVHFTFDPVREDYPNQLLFMVFDERSLDAYGGAYPYPPNGDAPYLIKGATLAELAGNLKSRLATVAAKAGSIQLADDFADSLAATVKRFNEYARSGVDPEFERGKHSYDTEWQKFFSRMRPGSRQEPNSMPNKTMHPLADAGPYYAVILAPGALDTNAGPLINEKAQVLAADGKPIPGLYGAGNCIASPTREAYMGAGGTVGPAITFGYIAGMNASKDAA